MNAPRLLLVAAVLLAPGCYLSAPEGDRVRCAADGVCAEGFACLGGTCVNATRATCTVGDRRCVDGVAWRCEDGQREAGDDCAARGLGCVSGSCQPACASTSDCPTGFAGCDPVSGACVPKRACESDADCAGGTCYAPPDAPDYRLCLAAPPSAALSDVTCYAAAGACVTATVPGRLTRLTAGPLPEVTLEDVKAHESFTTGGDARFARAATRCELLAFSLGEANAALDLPRQVFFGPTLRGATRETIALTALAKADVRALLSTEAGSAGPPYDPAGHALVAGQVRGCAGDVLGGATVAYSFRPGRVGYFGAALRRSSAEVATPRGGGFLAFDVPVEVPIYVVATARTPDRQLVFLGGGLVTAPRAQPDFPCVPVNVALGQGGFE